MYNFVTLFDKNYLSRGLALYESLKNKSSNFNLYILALDDDTFNYLKKNELDSAIILRLSDLILSYPVLSKLRLQRTATEFIWTLSAFSLQYAINSFDLDSCTYIDSDIFFFNNPELLFSEISKESSAFITEHNYTPFYDQTSISGKYCVQFVYIKNNNIGKIILEDWRKNCEISCTAKPSEGKFGDQKYLDTWTSNYSGVQVLHSYGKVLAPWNIQKYSIYKDNGLCSEDIITKERTPVVFYHFHGLRKYTGKRIFWKLSPYSLTQNQINLVYKPYIEIISELEENISKTIKLSFSIYKSKNCFEILYESFIKNTKMFIKSFFIIRTYRIIKQQYNSFYDNIIDIV